MAWIVITTDTLNEAKVAALIEACSSAAKEAGQDDRAPGIIQGIVNEVRGAVGFSKKYLVDEDPTKVPSNLRDLCVDLIIAKLKNAVEQDLSKDEADTVARRWRQIEKIAAGDWPVDASDAPVDSTVQSGGAAKLLSKPTDHPFSQLGTS